MGTVASKTAAKSVSAPARRVRFSVRCDLVTPELLSHVELARREKRLIGVEVDCRRGFDENIMEGLCQSAGAHKLVLQF